MGKQREYYFVKPNNVTKDHFICSSKDGVVTLAKRFLDTLYKFDATIEVIRNTISFKQACLILSVLDYDVTQIQLGHRLVIKLNDRCVYLMSKDLELPENILEIDYAELIYGYDIFEMSLG